MRLQAAIFHTWRIQDDPPMPGGGPCLDLLDGDAVSADGGRPRHEVEAQAGSARNGLGLRLNADRRQGTGVAGGPHRTCGCESPI